MFSLGKRWLSWGSTSSLGSPCSAHQNLLQKEESGPSCSKQMDELWWMVSTGEKQTAKAEGARPSGHGGFCTGAAESGAHGHGFLRTPPALLCCKGAKLKRPHTTVLKLFQRCIVSLA